MYCNINVEIIILYLNYPTTHCSVGSTVLVKQFGKWCKKSNKTNDEKNSYKKTISKIVDDLNSDMCIVVLIIQF